MIDNELAVTLQHDGTGLDNDAFQKQLNTNKGIGLKNISSRLQFIKGKIMFVQQSQHSFITEIKVPTA